MHLSTQELLQCIRLAAEDSSNVYLTDHGEERAVERGVDRLQICRILRRGRLVEGPWFDPNHGNYRFTMEGISAGCMLRVVAAVELADPITNSYVIVVTVIKG